ncbi:short-chain dehydrogenase [Pelomyxa schiedti]|nr:short-chain dehydrogenase [Pelomyxa schiedti]
MGGCCCCFCCCDSNTNPRTRSDGGGCCCKSGCGGCYSGSKFVAQFGPCALITGAAMGLGAEFAFQCAVERGLDLALVDIVAMDEIVHRIHATSPSTHVVTIQGDLTDVQFVQHIFEVTDTIDVGLLVCNAGVSNMGKFLDKEISTHLRVVDLNTRSPLMLAHHFGRKMVGRGRGGIILLSSCSALRGAPFVANYAATKAYNMILAESLWGELGPYGVHVTACLPGEVSTPGLQAYNPRSNSHSSTPAPVVRETLDGLYAHETRVIPGGFTKFAMCFLGCCCSRGSAINMVRSQMIATYPATSTSSTTSSPTTSTSLLNQEDIDPP